MDQATEQHLTSSLQDGVLVITVTETNVQGEAVAEALRQEMLAAVERTGARKVVVDFRHAQYISSTAFRPLLGLRRKLKEEGGQIVLCGLTSVVGDVFYTTRMVDPHGSVSAPFEMEPDVAAAVARLNRTPAEAP